MITKIKNALQLLLISAINHIYIKPITSQLNDLELRLIEIEINLP